METADFDYSLPEESIAQEPWPSRDECKLLAMDRKTGALRDHIFRDVIDYLNPGDVLIANETRVMPARLLGTKKDSGGSAEVFLLREIPGSNQESLPSQSPSTTKGMMHNEVPQLDGSEGTNAEPAQYITSDKSPNKLTQTADSASALWQVLVRPGRRLKPGAVIQFHDSLGTLVLEAEILDWSSGDEKGGRIARLTSLGSKSLDEAFHKVGHTPLPPYIKNYHGDEEMYQTVFSKHEKSAAAPTAGLHFTPELLKHIQDKGILFDTVELEVGLDTFRIVDEADPRNHKMHTEHYTLTRSTIDLIESAKERGNRVIAVGTTSVRSLESAWDSDTAALKERERATTSLFLLPGSTFHVVDGLITNFHVPRSTLMMLVSAFSSRNHIMAAYQHALDNGYRFLSFGDAMYIGDFSSH